MENMSKCLVSIKVKNKQKFGLVVPIIFNNITRRGSIGYSWKGNVFLDGV